MTQLTDSGHSKNVANFDALILIVKSFKDSYNPMKDSLQASNLEILSKLAKDSLSNVNSAFSLLNSSIDAREKVFESLDKLVSRVARSVKTIDSSDHIYQNTMTIVRKLQGRRATPKRTKEQIEADLAAGKEILEKSASQMSFDSRLENFDKLIKHVSGIEQYRPNEADLKVSSLSSLYQDMHAKNTAVVTAMTQLKQARMERNKILYDGNKGLTGVATDVKDYIKSVFGPSSPESKQLSKLRFVAH